MWLRHIGILPTIPSHAVARGMHSTWADVQVIFLKDGSTLELVGVEDHIPIRAFVEGNISL